MGEQEHEPVIRTLHSRISTPECAEIRHHSHVYLLACRALCIGILLPARLGGCRERRRCRGHGSNGAFLPRLGASGAVLAKLMLSLLRCTSLGMNLAHSIRDGVQSRGLTIVATHKCVAVIPPKLAFDVFFRIFECNVHVPIDRLKLA